MGLAEAFEPIAHTRNAAGQRQSLVEHLENVARLAAEFAAPFGGDQLAYWAGLWHDLGKFNPAFQRYLLEAEANPGGKHRRGPGHKAAGAYFAFRQGSLQLLALPIAGHHGGLPDLHGQLKALLAESAKSSDVEEALRRADKAINRLRPGLGVVLPAFLNAPLTAELFVRFLFSALVDADFLDTERHFQSHVAEERGGAPDIVRLEEELLAAQDQLSGKHDDAVNRLRDEVYRACLAAAEQAPGFFRLTVPTGGGKTRSGLAFALRHARLHGLERVIVAIPYTSITEQTASVYRSIFHDPRAVLEHHSAVAASERDDDALPNWSRLAAENWDAPIIVTTTVQLFESLLGHSPTACRKLHNVARSVIVLDEVQTLPPRLLVPILDVLRELVAHYGVSVVLCTATQPALDVRNGFPGIDSIREIVPEPARLFSALRRVRYDLRLDEPWPWERVAEEMRSSPQALAIVNTKRDALDLIAALDDPDTYHLSTLLCGAHRREMLAEIRDRLERGEPCRVVSTQVVEAGVDLDFPLVLRALGPLDRIVQAAGRCNREGRLGEGHVVIFRPAGGGMPPGVYRAATEATQHLLGAADFDFHEPAAYEEFFRRYYAAVDLDAERIQTARTSFDYPEVARRFRLIDEDAVPVVVPYASRDPDAPDPAALIEALRQSSGRARSIWRRLQPFVVNVRARQLTTYQHEGFVVEVLPGLWEWARTGGYHPRLGLVGGPLDPAELVI